VRLERLTGFLTYWSAAYRLEVELGVTPAGAEELLSADRVDDLADWYAPARPETRGKILT
jgi:hypothetical protein